MKYRAASVLLVLAVGRAKELTPGDPGEYMGLLQRSNRNKWTFPRKWVIEDGTYQLGIGGLERNSLNTWQGAGSVWPDAFFASRCDAEGVCELCANEPGASNTKDCWQGAARADTGGIVVGSGLAIYTEDDKWKKHVAEVTIECADKFTFKAFLSSHSGARGRLVVKVNDQSVFDLMTHNKTVLVGKGLDEGYFNISMERPENPLVKVGLEYIPFALGSDNSWPDIQLSSPRVEMNDEFASCEEMHLCLHHMMPDQKTPTKGSLLLRTRPDYQFQCLDGFINVSAFDGTLDDACKSWKKCLNASGQGQVEELKSILGASVDTVSKKSKKGTVSLVSLASRSTGCNSPTDMDPEAWDCECFDKMKAKCNQVNFHENYTPTICFQALLCNQAADVICAEWKNRNCLDNVEPTTVSPAEMATLEKVKQFQEFLLDGGLLARSSRSSALHNSNHFEESVANKQCP